MPGYLRPMAMMISRAICRSAGRAAATAASRNSGRCAADDSREIAGLPIDQIAEAVQPTEAQGAALDELGNASIAAAQNIRAACPTQVVLTAPGRLAAMQQRIEAMTSAVTTVRPALEKFYGLLNDEQKARLNALAEDQRKAAANNATGAAAQGCGAAQPAALEWPAGEIEARLHPDETQRGALAALRKTPAPRPPRSLKAACQAGRRDDAARAACRDRQAARYHAAGGQTGARRA